MANKVWIQIQTPKTKVGEPGHEIEVAGLEAKANRLMKRIFGEETRYQFFWVDSAIPSWRLIKDEAGAFYTLSDNGHWFDLDVAGRE